MLNEGQKKRLLQIARWSIEGYFRSGKAPELTEADPALVEKRGAFVTITRRGTLRGCIGYIEPMKPLYETVSEMAIQAAVGDPRFPAMAESELGQIKLEISALSPLKKIDDVSQIKVGTHGIMIRQGTSSGLLLPQVATEYGWSREEFLEHTCHKAGLAPDAWKKGAEISIFSGEVFGEER